MRAEKENDSFLSKEQVISFINIYFYSYAD